MAAGIRAGFPDGAGSFFSKRRPGAERSARRPRMPTRRFRFPGKPGRGNPGRLIPRRDDGGAGPGPPLIGTRGRTGKAAHADQAVQAARARMRLIDSW